MHKRVQLPDPAMQVPYVVLNLKRASKAPLATTGHAVLSALRSTSFLAAFVALYQGTVGVQRKLFAGDSKFLYYIAGASGRKGFGPDCMSR